MASVDRRGIGLFIFVAACSPERPIYVGSAGIEAGAAILQRGEEFRAVDLSQGQVEISLDAETLEGARWHFVFETLAELALEAGTLKLGRSPCAVRVAPVKSRAFIGGAFEDSDLSAPFHFVPFDCGHCRELELTREQLGIRNAPLVGGLAYVSSTVVAGAFSNATGRRVEIGTLDFDALTRESVQTRREVTPGPLFIDSDETYFFGSPEGLYAGTATSTFPQACPGAVTGIDGSRLESSWPRTVFFWARTKASSATSLWKFDGADCTELVGVPFDVGGTSTQVVRVGPDRAIALADEVLVDSSAPDFRALPGDARMVRGTDSNPAITEREENGLFLTRWSGGRLGERLQVFADGRTVVPYDDGYVIYSGTTVAWMPDRRRVCASTETSSGEVYSWQGLVVIHDQSLNEVTRVRVQ